MSFVGSNKGILDSSLLVTAIKDNAEVQAKIQELTMLVLDDMIYTLRFGMDGAKAVITRTMLPVLARSLQVNNEGDDRQKIIDELKSMLKEMHPAPEEEDEEDEAKNRNNEDSGD